jgi:hypothetical protein
LLGLCCATNGNLRAKGCTLVAELPDPRPRDLDEIGLVRGLLLPRGMRSRRAVPLALLGLLSFVQEARAQTDARASETSTESPQPVLVPRVGRRVRPRSGAFLIPIGSSASTPPARASWLRACPS